jgi:hypothetical protein
VTASGSGQQRDPAQRFFGWLLIVMGGLMLVLCGGCTVLMAGLGIAGAAASSSAVLSWLLIVGLIGGLPTAAGGALVWVGWLMVRRPRQTPKKVGETFD